jgi:ORF6N domain
VPRPQISNPESVAIPLIESRILLVRRENVLFDSDLAVLYQVETRALNQAVQRNLNRFPEDLMFQLTAEEWESLLAHSGTPKAARGGRRYAPFVFTEHGVVMLASVLGSPLAVEVSLAVVRTFIRLRKLLATHEDLARRLEQLEWRQSEQDDRVQYVFDTVQHLIDVPADAPKRAIGFPTSKSERALLSHAATPE